MRCALPVSLLCLSACGALPLTAADAIRYLAPQKTWVIDTANTTYAVGVNERGELQERYWGAKLTRPEDLGTPRSSPERASFDSSETNTNGEYPGWGGIYFAEPCLKLTRADGDRDLVLHYLDSRIDGMTLQLRAKDIRDNIVVTLQYHAYPDEDILRKNSRVENGTNQVVTIESAQSGVWYLPRNESYRLTYASGAWANEDQLTQEPVHQGKVVLESRRGNTSHQLYPWFALDENGQATEETGRVWFGEIAWSGNWKLVVEETPARQVRVVGGFNDFDFGYPLKPGESLETPAYYGGFSAHGFGGASRQLHRFEISEILPDHAHPTVRPVLYNSWEATEFNVNEEGQSALAAKAAKIGIERFVMDDGWFGARNTDHAGLGDWVVNAKKFPNGLTGLIRNVTADGMDFGLWFEPEMVNPDSDLYRKHPDWVMNFPGRPRSEARNQLVLNMARDDVKDYVFHALDRVLSENNIRFVKWDMNRHFGEPGWPDVPVAEQKEIWVKYVRNVYDIMDRLRQNHPGLEIESCSGGGGRVDLEILRRTDEVWPSDNTEAFDRLRIQEGFTYFYTPKVMMAWVTDVPNTNGRSTPLKYRFLVAMQGALAVGSNLNKWSDADFALATKMIAYYKTIRETVQLGELYRIFSPRTGEFTANQYVSQDGKQSVLFAFLHSRRYSRPMPTVRLRGLDESAIYRVKTTDNKWQNANETYSGSYVMNHGITLHLTGDYDGTVVEFDRER